MLGFHVSLSVPTTGERKRGEAVNLFSSLPPLLSLFVWILAGQRGAACRLVLCVFEAQASLCNCVGERAHLNSTVFSYHSSAGLNDVLWPSLFFPRPFLAHTNTNRVTSSALVQLSRSLAIQKIDSHMITPAHQRAPVHCRQIFQHTPLFLASFFLCFSIFPPLLTCLHYQVPVLQPMDLMVEATARRVFSNAHTYHINSISVNSDLQTFISTDDLRVNLWNLEITDRSFSILSQLFVYNDFVRAVICQRFQVCPSKCLLYIKIPRWLS